MQCFKAFSSMKVSPKIIKRCIFAIPKYPYAINSRKFVAVELIFTEDLAISVCGKNTHNKLSYNNCIECYKLPY